ncbi:uncharacterized protein LOC103713226 [Phoenix dactylifera]|uniref:Uncharacterized protein LOC103713226 n=1 Tax=Phoenix dactylifera TaxID=42345 RepID=A0A8B7CFM5_PHODC|nr:uncharacterized protein LOC103713226 [Phoenix dactylifera]
MAWNFAPSSSLPTAPPRIQGSERFPIKKLTVFVKPTSSEKSVSPCKVAQSEGVTEEHGLSGSSARTQLDLLEQLTSSSTFPGSGYESDGDAHKPTIREQLSELVGDREGDFSLPLGKKLKASRNSLTISQRRNIKRQTYLNEVARRNDSIFFATIGAFVILPPVAILSIAILTGYVQLFP